MDQVRKNWSIYVTAAVVLLAIGGGQFQLAVLADETKTNKDKIEANEARFLLLDRSIIERKGDVALELQELRLQQKVQSDKQDDMLQILRTIQQKVEKTQP